MQCAAHEPIRAVIPRPPALTPERQTVMRFGVIA